LPTLPPRRRFFVQFLFYWLPVLLYITTIVVLSSQPNLQPPLKDTDKFWHALEYLGLGILMARAIRSSMRVREPLFAALIALAFCILIAAGDEYYQSFIPGRDSSLYDLLADAAGGALSQFIYLWFARD
jgi:VanZ family protein